MPIVDVLTYSFNRINDQILSIKRELSQKIQPDLIVINETKGRLLSHLSERRLILNSCRNNWRRERNNYIFCAEVINASRNLAVAYQGAIILVTHINFASKSIETALDYIAHIVDSSSSDLGVVTYGLIQSHTSRLRLLFDNLQELKYSFDPFAASIHKSMLHITRKMFKNIEFNNDLISVLNDEPELLQWCEPWLMFHRFNQQGQTYDVFGNALELLLADLRVELPPMHNN